MSITIAFPVGYRPVLKHGEHDQSSHGSWATGNFDEETEGEGAQGNYFDKYGIKTDGSKEPVGISKEEIASLDRYTGDGYKSINAMLRGQKMEPGYFDNAEERRKNIEERVVDLDKLIEESPDLFGDKNLYRVFAEDVLSSVKEGDVITDKAYLSTTRVDITNPANVEVLQNLQMISETNDRTGIILPSPSKSGKGLAVDYMKNAVSDLFTNTSTANNEKEVLLPRNTSLKFMGYQKVNAGTDNVMEVAVFQRMDK
jgi:hypothetical protein